MEDCISKKYLSQHLLKDKGKVLLDLKTGIIYDANDIKEMNKEYFKFKIGAGRK